MMKYTVVFTQGALKSLKKLDKPTAALIVGWIRKKLDGCENPRQFGKALTANHSGEWRYRIGDYRVLAKIEDNIVTIHVLTVGHRRDIYQK